MQKHHFACGGIRFLPFSVEAEVFSSHGALSFRPPCSAGRGAGAKQQHLAPIPEGAIQKTVQHAAMESAPTEQPAVMGKATENLTEKRLLQTQFWRIATVLFLYEDTSPQGNISKAGDADWSAPRCTGASDLCFAGAGECGEGDFSVQLSETAGGTTVTFGRTAPMTF